MSFFAGLFFRNRGFSRSLVSSTLVCAAYIHSDQYKSNCELFASSITDSNSTITQPIQKPKDSSYSAAVSPPFPRQGPSAVTWNDDWDMRKDVYDKQKTKAVHQIVLIRHGQYLHQEKEEHQHSLTELGKYQASLSGKRLNELINAGIVYKPSRIFYSTMVRATETWEMIKPEINDHIPAPSHIFPCSMIREAAVCPPIPASEVWKPSQEAFFKNQQRVEAAFLKYCHRSILAENPEDQPFSTVLVCHGNVIRYFVMRALQLPPEAWLRTAVWNASITILEIYPNGRVSLRCLGDVGHIPAEKVTYM